MAPVAWNASIFVSPPQKRSWHKARLHQVLLVPPIPLPSKSQTGPVIERGGSRDTQKGFAFREDWVKRFAGIALKTRREAGQFVLIKDNLSKPQLTHRPGKLRVLAYIASD
jgi:hypothetical protein